MADIEKGPNSANMRISKSEQNFMEQGMRIVFKDLSLSLPHMTEKGVTAHLLKNVTGVLQPSEMTALMGPSGSGKTTLLDVLSGRKTTGTRTGVISFSGSTPSRSFLRKFTGYVEQFDTLLHSLNVREMLLYTAELKRSHHEPFAEKEAEVMALLEKLSLMVCKDVMIGNNMNKGISGGQAKRVNIGIALITDPRVLFLDEPTSGLDSFTANEVMTVVKSVARDDVTVCATIHSPTQLCFDLFDSLMILVRGNVVFFGRQGHEVMAYAMSTWTPAEKKVDLATVHNEAEWLTDLVTGADRAGRAEEFAALYEASAMKKATDERVAGYLENDKATVPESIRKALATDSETVTPWWWALKTLVKYRTPRNYQDSEFLGPRVGDKVLMSTLMWTLYWGIGATDKQSNLINISAVLFMWCVMPAYGAAGYVPSIVMERALYVRERSDGLYLAITYLIAKMLDELILAAFMSLGISAAAFYAIGFQGNFGLFWLVYFITLCIGVVLAYFVAAAAPTMDVANAVLPTYVTFLLFFGGFILDFNTMPHYWKWFSYLDFVRYSWGALMVNQFEGRNPIIFGQQDCDGPAFYLVNGTAQVNPAFGSFPCERVLDHYKLSNYAGNKYTIAGGASTQYTWYNKNVAKFDNVGFMCIFFLSYFCMAWVVLAKKNFSKR